MVNRFFFCKLLFISEDVFTAFSKCSAFNVVLHSYIQMQQLRRRINTFFYPKVFLDMMDEVLIHLFVGWHIQFPLKSFLLSQYENKKAANF